MVVKYFFFVCIACLSMAARAALDIEITGAGERQIPLSVVPFAGEESLAQKISDVIANDLKRSGLFRLVEPGIKVASDSSEVKYGDWAGVDGLVIGSVKARESAPIRRSPSSSF